MKSVLIIIVSCIVGFIACSFAFVMAGGGHGTYYAAKILFPYTMISTLFLASITQPFIFLAFAQFPLYGVIISKASIKGRIKLTSICLVIVHSVCVWLAFVLSSSSFSP